MLLHPRIQRWLWDSGWSELRDAQEHAIPLIVQGDGDLIIAASTASGKTEAALLPILTRMADRDGALVMYISPLKALINDQYRRMEELAGLLEIPVTPWHGDITQTRKTKFLKDPKGCLLITPESLEALLMRHGHDLRRILGALQFVVVDELHAFMGTERGKQLQSLLHRIDQALARKARRIGLSATLGDMEAAKEFLHPDAGNRVDLVESKEKGQELRVLVKGVLDSDAPPALPGTREEALRDNPAKLTVASDLYQALRGTNNLVFPNSRSEVEFYSDRLRKQCEEERVPNEFWPHHGSLSKEIREETEAALKQKERPATAICTSTLELGIDIGSVKSVVQIGPPPSVASLRQRLGRSGRRKGEPSILRGYMVERELTSRSGLSDLLREGLVQMVAMIQLLVEGWYEPINVHGLHASTLVQQLLSSLSQHGGLHAGQAWLLLCGTGSFRAVPKEAFLALLRALGELEIIFQDSTGLLLLAPKGERITQNYHFYASFSSDEEYRIVTTGKTLGTLPINQPLTEGSFVIFAGRRWLVLSVSEEEKVIEVVPAKGGKVPGFEGRGRAVIHDKVRETMREILSKPMPIPFLDPAGQRLLKEARENYARLALDSTWLCESNDQVQILLWKGDRVNDTLLLMLMDRGFRGYTNGLVISLEATSRDAVQMALSQFAHTGEIEPQILARSIKNKVREKWDPMLPEGLLNASFGSSYLDPLGVIRTIRSLQGEIDSR
jgi:ATP-dependent Lhr-like helicase